MGSGSSVTSAIDDFNNVTYAMSYLESSIQYRVKNGFDMIEQLGTFITQLENLKIKLNLEERAMKKESEWGASDANLRKLQSRAAYVNTTLTQLQDWRVEEEMNIARLRKLEKLQATNKILLSRLE